PGHGRRHVRPVPPVSQSTLRGAGPRVFRPHAGARLLVGDRLAGGRLDRHAPRRHPARGALPRAEVRRRLSAVPLDGSKVYLTPRPMATFPVRAFALVESAWIFWLTS